MCVYDIKNIAIPDLVISGPIESSHVLNTCNCINSSQILGPLTFPFYSPSWLKSRRQDLSEAGAKGEAMTSCHKPGGETIHYYNT